MVDPVISEASFRGLTGRVHSSGRAVDVPADGAAAVGAAAVGAAAPPAFVLIHGIGVSHSYLTRLHQLLARTAETHSFDLPGFGGTPKPGRQLSVPDYAAFVAAALDQRGVTSAVVVGHSMGTQVAVEISRLRPDLAVRLILMGPVVDVRRRTAVRQAWDLAVDCLFFETPTSNWLVSSDYVRCGPRWYLTELPVMLSYPIEERITAVEAPVLVLRGGRDPVASQSWCRQLAGLAPAGQFHEVPRQGHVVQHTASEEVAEVIQEFVASPGMPSGSRA